MVQELIQKELVTPVEASQWASNYLDRPVTPSNISYLIQYAKVKRYLDEEKKIKINLGELKKYYDLNIKKKNESWKNVLGKDLNWDLSFSHLRESDTTKHVHRLHPYKGKFIPQLVEYFLNQNPSDSKRPFFQQNDIILDPFMGSGTTLVQALELGLHSIGIDVSDFNCSISEAKIDEYDLFQLNAKLMNSLSQTLAFRNEVFDNAFDLELKERLNELNTKYFPNPEFKRSVWKGSLKEEEYSQEKLKQFLKENEAFFKKNGTKDKTILLEEENIGSFLSKWFPKRVKQELYYYSKLIDKEQEEQIRNIMRIVLSRTARSCRATTHSDLATLREPQASPYYCSKHKKICTPINTITSHLRRYTFDTVARIRQFSKLKKEVFSEVIHGDSREVNVSEEIKAKNSEFYKILTDKKIDGVFTSPPYVGQIDYHEQHAYAYELFGISRKDDKEIGPLSKGQGKEARDEYVEEISQVFRNISTFVKDNGDFFVVANDKYNLYPIIAEKSGLTIVETFKRPVLNRTERDRQPYAEIIFHMRKK